MSEKNATSETATTTVTTTVVETTQAPTGDRSSVNYPGGDASPNAERQGEIVADKSADTNVVGGVSSKKGAVQDDADALAQNLENAKQDGLRNAAREVQSEEREAEVETSKPGRKNS